MRVLDINVLDGQGTIQVAVKNDQEFFRLKQLWIEEAGSCQTESEYYAELNRGYAKDRA